MRLLFVEDIFTHQVLSVRVFHVQTQRVHVFIFRFLSRNTCLNNFVIFFKDCLLFLLKRNSRSQFFVCESARFARQLLGISFN